jgi:hypothetical protein
MDHLGNFKELAADIQHSEIKIPIMDIELTLSVKYFLNDSGRLLQLIKLIKFMPVV